MGEKLHVDAAHGPPGQEADRRRPALNRRGGPRNPNHLPASGAPRGFAMSERNKRPKAISYSEPEDEPDQECDRDSNLEIRRHNAPTLDRDTRLKDAATASRQEPDHDPRARRKRDLKSKTHQRRRTCDRPRMLGSACNTLWLCSSAPLFE